MENNILMKPENLFFRVRAQSLHGGGTNTNLSINIPFQQGNINLTKFFNKMVKIVVEQVDIRAWNTGPADPFDGLNFIINQSQPYGQVNAFTNPNNISPDRSLVFLGLGELRSQASSGGDFTFRNNSYEEGIITYLDGTPLNIQVADWSGTPYTSSVAAGLDSVSCWWSIILRIHLLDD